MGSSSSSGAQRLINLILQKFVISRKEAYEALIKVKKKNGGVLKGLKFKRFLRMVGKVIREKRLKEMQEEKDHKRKWRGTCSFCYKMFFDNQDRDRHMKNAHSDTVIEAEDMEAGTAQQKVEELSDEEGDITGTAHFLLEEILDDIVKKSNINLGDKCPEYDKIFSHKISMKRHLKHHAAKGIIIDIRPTKSVR